jgi:Ca2+ transporting ATPase
MLPRAWTYSPQDALAFYDTHADNGLTEDQVKRNRELYGENCMSASSFGRNHELIP